VAWLGRSVLVFRRRGEKGGVELVVCWRISVDDVGEAESGLSADVRYPGCCEYFPSFLPPSSTLFFSGLVWSGMICEGVDGC
jgi:hypothetical protein